MIGNIVPAGQIKGNFIAKLNQAAVPGVLGFTVKQGVDRSVTEQIRGFKIGFTDTQGDGILPGSGEIKKTPDTAGRYSSNPAVQILVVVHGEITSL